MTTIKKPFKKINSPQSDRHLSASVAGCKADFWSKSMFLKEVKKKTKNKNTLQLS